MQTSLFRIEPHPQHHRLRRIRFRTCFNELLDSESKQMTGIEASISRLFERYSSLTKSIEETLRDRYFAGVAIEFAEGEHAEIDEPSFALFCEKLAEKIGTILPEDRQTHGTPMAPAKHVIIPLSHGVENPGRQMHFTAAGQPWPLHTDRALKEDAGDFLLVAKSAERGGSGGMIRLLHIEDFTRLDEFLADPLAYTPLYWRYDPLLGPQEEQFMLRDVPRVYAPVFSKVREQICVRFTDFRFRRPSSVAQAQYLERLGNALQNDAETTSSFKLPEGGLYIINNRRMLHGREGFTTTPEFCRRLIRICGNLRC